MNPQPDVGRPRARPDPSVWRCADCTASQSPTCKHFLWEPLGLHEALAQHGSAEERVLRVIEEEFFRGTNNAHRAVPISYRTFRRRTGLSNSQITDAIEVLEGQRIIAVLRGKWENTYAINPPDAWRLKPRRRASGAADRRWQWARSARKLAPVDRCELNTQPDKVAPVDRCTPARALNTTRTGGSVQFRTGRSVHRREAGTPKQPGWVTSVTLGLLGGRKAA